MKKYSILFFLFFSLNVSAEEYLGKDLSTWPQSESRKVKNDFGAWLLVTSDLNWQEKWDTPPDTIPYFNEADRVRTGDELVILTFYTNPGTKKSGYAHVKCSLKVERPDGSFSIPEQTFDCLNGMLQGNLRNIRLSPAVVQFKAEESDPVGVWKVYVSLVDVTRGTRLDLKTTYTHINDNG